MISQKLYSGRKTKLPSNALLVARIAKLKTLLLLAGLAFAGQTSAWDGAVIGTISQIDTVANEPNDYEVRIYLGGITMCTATNGTQDFAYMNSTDNNFKATLANLMMAYSMGKTVNIYTMNDSSVGCHIHYVMVKG